MFCLASISRALVKAAMIEHHIPNQCFEVQLIVIVPDKKSQHSC